MTAAALIETLRAHPKTCGVLGITDQGGNGTTFTSLCGAGLYINMRSASAIQGFHRWIVGAVVLKADEMGIDINETRHGWVGTTGREEERVTLTKMLPTRLAATFAAIEASL